MKIKIFSIIMVMIIAIPIVLAGPICNGFISCLPFTLGAYLFIGVIPFIAGLLCIITASILFLLQRRQTATKIIIVGIGLILLGVVLFSNFKHNQVARFDRINFMVYYPTQVPQVFNQKQINLVSTLNDDYTYKDTSFQLEYSNSEKDFLTSRPRYDAPHMTIIQVAAEKKHLSVEGQCPTQYIQFKRSNSHNPNFNATSADLVPGAIIAAEPYGTIHDKEITRCVLAIPLTEYLQTPDPSRIMHRPNGDYVVMDEGYTLLIDKTFVVIRVINFSFTQKEIETLLNSMIPLPSPQELNNLADKENIRVYE